MAKNCEVGSGEQISASLMAEGEVDPKAVCLAIDDARIIVEEQYGIPYKDDNFTVLVRYYAVHIMYTWGILNRLVAVSVDDVSETRKDINFGEKEGMSPYLSQFLIMLGGEDDDFIFAR